MRTPNEIVSEAIIAINGCSDLPTLEQVKAGFVGKSGTAVDRDDGFADDFVGSAGLAIAAPLYRF